MKTFAFYFFLSWVLGVVFGFQSPSLASEPLLKSIRFEKTSENEETVFFELNGFSPPEVFGLKGDNPRLVCDFKKVHLGETLNKVIETNGNLILRIRVGIYTLPIPKIRIVLDLARRKNYSIEQIFFQKDTTFAIIVRPDNSTKD